MPTHTPSPHRFLAPNPPSTQKSKPKPQSGLRNAVAIPRPTSSKKAAKPDLQFKKLTPAKRFVIAPTRHLEDRGTSKEKEEARVETNTHFTPRPKPPRKFERVESIEEPSQSTHEQERADDDDDEDAEEEELLFETVAKHKRRRISPPNSPSQTSPPEPQTPAQVSNPTIHRFKITMPRTPVPFPTISTSSSTTTTPAPGPHRPHFLLQPLPPSSPHKQPSRPLPEIFSPSRKSGKYIPNGLASTLTGWIIEAAATNSAPERSAAGMLCGRDIRDDGVKMRIRLTGLATDGGGQEVLCVPGGVVFVKGVRQNGMCGAGAEDAEMKVLIAGIGGVRGVAGVKIRIGCLLGVRAPVWDVVVGDETWVVAIDWVVLG
ncbi:hypothetical protein BDW02DRAFT_490806 [Decorospora gaudefroyi]|uniref:Uncharacterized protein n=1 Tax=Decorospora gaudefroyi TaxID=184978 RepID=A0A6A5KRI6_9PLEO|nr:hypothetical protein BDW02DRAFT_490806 [Decorospora gaudefroyi]